MTKTMRGSLRRARQGAMVAGVEQGFANFFGRGFNYQVQLCRSKREPRYGRTKASQRPGQRSTHENLHAAHPGAKIPDLCTKENGAQAFANSKLPWRTQINAQS